MAEVTKLELIKEWIKDLRSGEFKQCQSTMYDALTDSHCCLDVLVLTAARLGVGTIGSMRGLKYPFGDVVQILGSHNPRVEYEGTVRCCDYLNDNACLSFEQIADLLEKEYIK